VLGLDASFATINQATFTRMKGLGYGIFIEDCWTGGYANNPSLRAVAEPNLRNAQAAGLIIAIYSNANPWYDVQTSVRETKANAGGMWDAVKVVAVDLEIAGTTEQQAFDLGLAFEAEGKKVCVYTARWVHDRDGNPPWTRLARWPLWVCQADKKPDIGTTRPVASWSATQIIGKQFDTDTGLFGKAVDLNMFEESFFEEEDMNETQLTAILAVFNVLATPRSAGQPLDSYFDPLPDETWAAAWRWLGAPTPPPQPSIGSGRRWLGLIAGDFRR